MGTSFRYPWTDFQGSSEKRGRADGLMVVAVQGAAMKKLPSCEGSFGVPGRGGQWVATIPISFTASARRRTPSSMTSGVGKV